VEIHLFKNNVLKNLTLFINQIYKCSLREVLPKKIKIIKINNNNIKKYKQIKKKELKFQMLVQIYQEKNNFKFLVKTLDYLMRELHLMKKSLIHKFIFMILVLKISQHTANM
jgi:hypothetical protein